MRNLDKMGSNWGFRWVHIGSDGFRLVQMRSHGFICVQMCSDWFRLVQIDSDGSDWFRWAQIGSDGFRLFQMGSFHVGPSSIATIDRFQRIYPSSCHL